MRNKVLYRIIVYVLVLTMIGLFTFLPGLSSGGGLVYWIIGGIFFGLSIIAIIINEVKIYKNNHEKK